MRLWKDGLAERIDLVPLGRDDATELVEEIVGGPVEVAAMERLWRLTRGNPLFVREVVLEGLTAGTIVEDGGVWTTTGPLTASAGLEQIIEVRLADVTADERRLLELVALAEPLDHRLVAQLLGDDGVLPDLERRGLVRLEEGGHVPHVRLAHPPVRRRAAQPAARVAAP